MNVKDIYTIPEKFTLYQNYPNPFNPSTTIRFEIPERSKVPLNIYNMLGQRVASITDSEYSPGVHEIKWHSNDFASEIYFYRINAVSTEDPSRQYVQTKSMMIIK